MKLIYCLITTMAISFAGFSQKGVYVKYESNVQATGEDAEMMAMMMNGSTMEIAANSDETWVRTQMGTMMTMTMGMDSEKEEMTILMSGMMGTLAYQGNPDEMDDEEEEEVAQDMELIDETKDILGYTCKKAVITDEDGNQATYWYTEKIKRPDAVSQMPNQVPGMCLEFEIAPQEGLTVTYTAIELDEKVKMEDYAIEIPEGTEVQSLSAMGSMGGM